MATDFGSFDPSAPEAPLAPSVPTIRNQQGDIVGQGGMHRYDPLSMYMPSPEEIQQHVNVKEKENRRGAFWDLLALPEKLTFGQAFKGAVRGGAEGGVSGAVEGFLRGTPFAFASDYLFGTDISRETTASDIRRAFGDTSEQSGAANFFTNLAIDVALDPITFLINPFGKTAQGTMKAIEGARHLEQISKVVQDAGLVFSDVEKFKILDGYRVSGSLAKAIDIGDRAAVVLKAPWMKFPMFESNLGFKSASLGFAKALDWTMSAVRTGPLGKVIKTVNSNYHAIADPEANATVKAFQSFQTDRRKQVMAVWMADLTSVAKKTDIEFIARHPEYNDAVLTAAELGEQIDDMGQITRMYSEPDLMAAENTLRRRLAVDGKFRGLYEKATSIDPDKLSYVRSAQKIMPGDAPLKEASDALDVLYHEYKDTPLPTKLLDAAGLKPRVGTEFSVFDDSMKAPGLSETIADSHPGSLSRTEITRAAISDSVPSAEKAARQTAIDRAKQQFHDIMELPVEDRDKINRYLKGRAYAMANRAKAEALGHVMDASFDIYAGPYVYRMMSDEAKAIINSTVKAKIATLGAQGVAVNERFLRDRDFTNITTIEASAIAEQLGIKSTGYTPLKELAEKYNKQGADGVFGWIFDKPFIRQLWQVDPNSAQFFATNPLHSDYTRAMLSGRALGKMGAYEILFDSILKKNVSKMSDLATTKQMTDRGMVGAVPTFKNGKTFEEKSTAQLIKDGMAPEVAARYEIARYQIKNDLTQRLGVQGADFGREMDMLDRALEIHPKLSAEDLHLTEGDSIAMARMKTSAMSIAEAADKKANISEASKAWERISKGVEQKGSVSPIAEAKISEYARRFDTTVSKINKDFVSQLAAEKADLAAGISSVQSASTETQAWMRMANRGQKSSVRSEIDSLRASKADVVPEAQAMLERGASQVVDDRRKIAEAISGKREDLVRIGEQGSAERKAFLLDMQRSIDQKKARIASLEQLIEDTKDKQSYISANIKLERDAADIALKDAKDTHEAVISSIRDAAADMKDTYVQARDRLRAVSEGASRRLTMNRQAGLGGSQFNQELKTWHIMKQRHVLGLDEAKSVVLEDGSTLHDKLLKSDPDVHWFQKDEFEAAKSAINNLDAPDFLRDTPIRKALDYVKSVWAPYTAVNPLFIQSRVRDQVTNFISLLSHGFSNPSVVPEVAGIQMALKDIKNSKLGKDALEAISVSRTLEDGTVESLTRRHVIDTMQSQGHLSSQSQWASEFMQSAEDFASMHKEATAGEIMKDALSAILPIKKGMNSAVIRTGAQFSGWLDDGARMAGWLDAWKRGMSVDQASEHISRVLYNGLKSPTSLERSILMPAIPFYGFSKWAIGQSVDAYLQHPGTLATIQKIRDNSYNSPIAGGPPIDPAQMDTIMPQFLSDGMGIPYKNTAEGPRFMAFGSYLPVGEISQLVAGIKGMLDPNSTNGMLNYIGAKLNPAIKLPLTMFVNRDLYSDKPVEGYPGERYNFLGASLSATQYEMAKQLRFISELDRLKLFTHEQTNQIIAAQQDGGAKPVGQREELPFAERLIGSGFGFAPKTHLLDVADQSMIDRAKRDHAVMEAKSRLKNAVIKSEGSPAAADNARALKIVLADKLADRAMENQLSLTYGVDAKQQQRALKRQNMAALTLMRSKSQGQ